MFEFDDIESPVRDKIAALEAAWRVFLGGLVRRAVELGDFRADLDVEQFVWELGGIYLAHHKRKVSILIDIVGVGDRAKLAVNSRHSRFTGRVHQHFVCHSIADQIGD